MDQRLGHGRGRQLELVRPLLLAIEPAKELFVVLGADRILPVDPFLEMRDRVLADHRADRAGLDQHEVDAGAAHLQPKDVRQPLQREFGRDIGAAPLRADDAQDGGAIDDPPLALAAHQGDHPPRQVVIAEEVDLEDLAQSAARQVLRQSRAGIGAVVEQHVDPVQPRHRRRDRLLVGIVEPEALQSLAAQALAVFLLAAGGQHAPAALGHGMGGIVADARRTAGDEDRAHGGLLCAASYPLDPCPASL